MRRVNHAKARKSGVDGEAQGRCDLAHGDLVELVKHEDSRTVGLDLLERLQDEPLPLYLHQRPLG